MKILGILTAVIWLSICASAYAAERVWCRGPAQIGFQANVLNLEFKPAMVAAGISGGRLQPGECGYENSVYGGDVFRFQLVDHPAKWQEQPSLTMNYMVRIQLLSSPEYVVSMGTKEKPPESYLMQAIPFRADVSLPKTPAKLRE